MASLDGERISLPALRADVVDTVGAGDSFTAGLLHHLGSHGLLGGRLTGLRMGDVAQVCAFGAPVAALACVVTGPNPLWEHQLQGAAVAGRE
jgi:fructokinase